MEIQSPPLLSVIEPRRLYRQIAEVLLDHIEKGTFPVGSFLPPERELATQLGVSRTSVREALIALEIQGRVNVRVGSGVTVLSVPVPTATENAEEWPDVGPLEVVDARLLIECETAFLAATRVNDEDIEELEDIVARLDVLHREDEVLVELDRDFHLKIAECSGNHALAGVLKLLWDYRKSTLFSRFEGHFVTKSLYEKSSDDHQHILDALCKKDPKLAKAAMSKHLKRVRATYMKSL